MKSDMYFEKNTTRTAHMTKSDTKYFTITLGV